MLIETPAKGRHDDGVWNEEHWQWLTAGTATFQKQTY